MILLIPENENEGIPAILFNLENEMEGKHAISFLRENENEGDGTVSFLRENEMVGNGTVLLVRENENEGIHAILYNPENENEGIHAILVIVKNEMVCNGTVSFNIVFTKEGFGVISFVRPLANEMKYAAPLNAAAGNGRVGKTRFVPQLGNEQNQVLLIIPLRGNEEEHFIGLVLLLYNK